MLRTQTAVGTRVYDLSAFGGGVSVFERQRDYKRRKKPRQQHQQHEDVVLLQAFEFPVASSCIRVSPDLNYICATGVYPPQASSHISYLHMKFVICYSFPLHFNAHVAGRAASASTESFLSLVSWVG